jgi:hypothetical protein
MKQQVGLAHISVDVEFSAYQEVSRLRRLVYSSKIVSPQVR